MKLFDELQARFLSPETGSGRTYGRLGTNNGLSEDPKFKLLKMHRSDIKFQEEIDEVLRSTVESQLAVSSCRRER